MPPKDMNQQPYVRLEKLCIGYRTGRHRQRTVASGIDATLPAGQLTCLIGRNGTGKSTLLRTVASLQPRLGGRIYIDGTDSATLSQKEMARRVSIVLTAPPSTINSPTHRHHTERRTATEGDGGESARAGSAADAARRAHRLSRLPVEGAPHAAARPTGTRGGQDHTALHTRHGDGNTHCRQALAHGRTLAHGGHDGADDGRRNDRPVHRRTDAAICHGAAGPPGGP